MYEIHTHDKWDQVLATADTLDGAITAVDYLVAVTGRQLATNGEGTDEFWLCIAVRDVATGRDEYWTHTNCGDELSDEVTF